MNHIELQVANKSFSFTLVSFWDELSKGDLLRICRLSRLGLDKGAFMTAAVMGMLPEKVQAILMNLYAALSYAGQRTPFADQREMLEDASTDVAYQFTRLMDLMEWMTQPSALTKNPFPVLKVARRKYQGPKDGLKDMTYYDYALVDLLLQDMAIALQENQPADAETAKAKIVAVLWKRPGEPYDEKRTEQRSKIFSKLPAEWLDAIYIFVTGSLRQIISSYPRIFSAGQGSEKTPEGTYGHAELVLDLAGGKFGDIEKTQNTSLHTILLYLEHEARKAEKKQKQDV